MAAGPGTAAPPVQGLKELERSPLEDRLHVRGRGDEAVIAALRKPGRRATLVLRKRNVSNTWDACSIS